MIAKIKTDNGVYNSVIFGFWGNSHKTKAVVMSEDNSTLQIIEYWKPNRRIFIIDENRDDWIKRVNFEGYDGFIKI